MTALEAAMADLAAAQADTQRELALLVEQMRASDERSKRTIEASQRSMDEFKAEMRASDERSKREMDEFKAEMRASDERSKREMDEFKAEMKRMRREYGDIANSHGRFVEDIVLPGARYALRELFRVAPGDFTLYAIRQKPPHRTTRLRREFDLVAAWPGGFVLCSAKAKPNQRDLAALVELVPVVSDYFPEAQGAALYGCLATLYTDPSLVTAASKAGIIVLGIGEELLEVVNGEGFEPRAYGERQGGE